MNKEKIRKLSMAALSFVFMVSIAGYINYKYNPEREKDLGQTVYVSSNNDEVNIYKEQNNNVSKLEKIRNDRDNMYLELSNNYSEIINNSNSNADTISEYQEKLSELVEEKNKITMAENIIKSRGIEDVVIVITNSKASAIVKCNQLDETQIAQIMQLIVDQLDIKADDITIETSNV